MDIDVGPIERIKVWPDLSKSGPPSSIHLDSIIIYKKYSLSQSIPLIYNDRLEQISNALYRRGNSKGVSVHRSDDRISNGKNSGHERLGSSRSILRSLTVSDKVNFHKKVTWDEQSLTSQDDSILIDQPSRTRMLNTNEQIDHQIIWISSHNYLDHQWMIRSIEENQSFDFDSTTRSRLLSDRLPMKTSQHGYQDEIIQFDIQRPFGKDKQIEMILTPSNLSRKHDVPLTTSAPHSPSLSSLKFTTSRTTAPSPRLTQSKSLHRQDSIGGLTGLSTIESRSLSQSSASTIRSSPVIADGRRSDLLPTAMHRHNDSIEVLRRKPIGSSLHSLSTGEHSSRKKSIVGMTLISFFVSLISFDLL